MNELGALGVALLRLLYVHQLGAGYGQMIFN